MLKRVKMSRKDFVLGNDHGQEAALDAETMLTGNAELIGCANADRSRAWTRLALDHHLIYALNAAGNPHLQYSGCNKS